MGSCARREVGFAELADIERGGVAMAPLALIKSAMPPKAENRCSAARLGARFLTLAPQQETHAGCYCPPARDWLRQPTRALLLAVATEVIVVVRSQVSDQALASMSCSNTGARKCRALKEIRPLGLSGGEMVDFSKPGTA